MPRTTKNFYWDSCVFLHQLNGEPQADIVAQLWDEAVADPGIRIFTSAVSVVELAYYRQENAPVLTAESVALIDAYWDHPKLLLVETNPEIGKISRELKRVQMAAGNWQNLKPLDGIQLATASFLTIHGVPFECFFTFDGHLTNYGPSIGTVVREPFIQQPRLPLAEGQEHDDD